MRDDDGRPPGRLAPEDAEEAAVRELLAEAGPRPPLVEEDVDAVAAAAREALHRRLARPAGPAAAEGEPGAPTGPAPLRWLPLAALLAVALGLGAWWAVVRPSAGAPDVARVEAVRGELVAVDASGAASPLAAGAAVVRGARVCTAGEASRAALALTGGVALRLDAGTCLRLVAASRVDLERGAVFADTGGDGGSLAVDTPLGTIRDVGTRFTVRLRDDAVEVQVRDGAVEVAGEHRAGAGEELVLHRGGRIERHRAATWGPGWEWVLEAAGGFAIEGRSLAELLDWAARESGWRLRYADPALAAAAEEIVLHGDLGELRPDEAPFAVLPGAGLEGRLDDGVLVVSRPARP